MGPPIDLEFKFVIIGDGAVGKTSLLMTFINKGFPDKYEPTIMDQYNVDLPFQDETMKLSIWDTAGQENFGELRNLSYPDVDLFIVCYSCVGRASFNNIKPMWLEEVKKNSALFVLVGTKSDLINQIKEEEGEHSIVHKTEAETLLKSIEGKGSFQCSALMNQGVQDVFKRSVKFVYDERVAAQPGGGCCTLL